MKKILILAALVSVPALAFKPLINLKSWTQNVQPTVADGGTVAARVSTGDGYNSIICCNLTQTPVYVGPASVKADGGFAICANTTVCADKCISLDTHAPQFYANLAARVDGGIDISCLAGQ